MAEYPASSAPEHPAAGPGQSAGTPPTSPGAAGVAADAVAAVGGAQTAGLAGVASAAGPFVRWTVALAALAVVLTLMHDAGPDAARLADGLALLILAAALMTRGPRAVAATTALFA